ncbi:MAG: hypothetical protein QM601_06270 [Pseudoxanthomonas sp.]
MHTATSIHADLQAKQVGLKAEIERLARRKQELAFATATGDDEAAASIREVEGQMAESTREIGIIEAAYAESHRQVDKQDRAEQWKQFKAQGQAALQALDQVEAKFAEALGLIEQLEQVRFELRDLDQDAFAKCLKCTRKGRSEDVIHASNEARNTVDTLAAGALDRWRKNFRMMPEDVARSRAYVAHRLRNVTERVRVALEAKRTALQSGE